MKIMQYVIIMVNALKVSVDAMRAIRVLNVTLVMPIMSGILSPPIVGKDVVLIPRAEVPHSFVKKSIATAGMSKWI